MAAIPYRAPTPPPPPPAPVKKVFAPGFHDALTRQVHTALKSQAPHMDDGELKKYAKDVVNNEELFEILTTRLGGLTTAVQSPFSNLDKHQLSAPASINAVGFGMTEFQARLTVENPLPKKGGVTGHGSFTLGIQPDTPGTYFYSSSDDQQKAAFAYFNINTGAITLSVRTLEDEEIGYFSGTGSQLMSGSGAGLFKWDA